MSFIVEAAVAQSTMNEPELKTTKSLNRIFLLSAVLGVFPLSCDFDSVTINYKTLVISLFIGGLFFPKIGSYVLWDLVPSLENNIDEISIVIQYTAIIAFTIYLIWNKNQFILLEEYFFKIEREFMKFGISPSYEVRWLQDISILILALLSFLAAPLSTRSEAVTLHYCYKTLIGVGVAWQCFAIVQPFVQCVRIIGNKFTKVREIFSGISRSQHDFNTNDKLEATIRLYDRLCSASELLMDLFSLQLLFVFFLVLLNVVVSAFRLLLTLKSYSKIFNFFLYFFNLTYHAVVCVYITTCCKRTKEEADGFNCLLNEVMIEDGANNLYQNRKLRLHVTMKREITFNALGFLNLDYTLVHSVIAAATTYLVILLQFNEDTSSTSQPDSLN